MTTFFDDGDDEATPETEAPEAGGTEEAAEAKGDEPEAEATKE